MYSHLMSQLVSSSHLISSGSHLLFVSSRLSSSCVFCFILSHFVSTYLFPLLLILLFYYNFNLILSLTFKCVFTLCHISSSLISSGSHFVLFWLVPSLVLSLLVLFCHLVLYLLLFNLCTFILSSKYTVFLYVYANVGVQSNT